jgi:hypothetical protein
LSSFTQSLGTELENSQASLEKRYLVYGRTEEHLEISPTIGIAIEQGYEGGIGFGIGGGCFYMFDSEFGLGVLTHLYLFGSSYVSASTYETQSGTLGSETTTTTESDSSLELVPALKYKFDGSVIRPYLIAGVGVALISASDTYSYNYHNGPPLYTYGTSSAPESKIFPVLEGGGGLELVLEEDLNLFVEVRADLIIGDYATATYIPIEGGLTFSL